MTHKLIEAELNKLWEEYGLENWSFKEEVNQKLTQLLERQVAEAERLARIDELEAAERAGARVAATRNTSFEELSQAYDNHIQRRLKALTTEPEEDV